MTILSVADLPTDTPGMWCRQSRLAGVVRFIVFCVIFAIPPVLGWKFNQPWLLWPGAALASFILLLLLRDLAAMFRATNWLLYIGPDSLWLNLHSYRDKVSTEASVVRFEYGEISTVGRHTERYATPSELVGPGSYGDVGGSTIWKDEFLEIRLTHEQTDELKTALNELRSPPRSNGHSFRKAQFRNGCFYPLWLVSPSVLRITWLSGHGPLIRPSIRRTLAELGTHVRIAAPTERRRPDWRKLAEEDVVPLARELVQVHGAGLEATTLLVRAGGLAYGEANTLVQKISAEDVC